METRKIIVTGGAGFIGSHLAKDIVNTGHEVIVVDNFSTGKRENLAPFLEKIQLVECDLANHRYLFEQSASFGKVDFIFHLAALPRIGRSVDFPLETHRANVTGTLVALELAKKLEVQKFIFSSSSSVYGEQKKVPLAEDLIPNPQNPYAVQKLVGELYCQNYSKVFGLKTLAFRLFNVYGLGMSAEGAYKLVFNSWLEQKRQGLPLTVFGDGKQTRDFTQISDVVRGLIAGMDYEQEHPFELINLGAGRQVEINYLASLFDHKVEHVSARQHEEKFKEADITRAKNQLGWEPRISIEEGLAKLLE